MADTSDADLPSSGSGSDWEETNIEFANDAADIDMETESRIKCKRKNDRQDTYEGSSDLFDSSPVTKRSRNPFDHGFQTGFMTEMVKQVTNVFDSKFSSVEKELAEIKRNQSHNRSRSFSLGHSPSQSQSQSQSQSLSQSNNRSQD